MLYRSPSELEVVVVVSCEAVPEHLRLVAGLARAVSLRLLVQTPKALELLTDLLPLGLPFLVLLYGGECFSNILDCLLLLRGDVDQLLGEICSLLVMRVDLLGSVHDELDSLVDLRYH